MPLKASAVCVLVAAASHSLCLLLTRRSLFFFFYARAYYTVSSYHRRQTRTKNIRLTRGGGGVARTAPVAVRSYFFLFFFLFTPRWVFLHSRLPYRGFALHALTATARVQKPEGRVENGRGRLFKTFIVCYFFRRRCRRSMRE